MPPAPHSDDDRSDEEQDIVVDPEVMAERRARRSGGEDAGIEGRLADIEAELAAARMRIDELRTELGVRERELGVAREREFAEQRLRLEAEADLGRDQRELAAEAAQLRAALATAEARIAALEAEVARADGAAQPAGEAAPAPQEDPRVAELQARVDEEQRARAAQRRAFDAHVAALERGIATAREQLAALGAELATERAVLDDRVKRADDALTNAQLLAATDGADDRDALVAVRKLAETVGPVAPPAEGAEVAEGDAEPDDEASRISVPLVPPADHPALAEIHGERAAGAESVIDDLARAAARLRAQIEGTEGPAAAPVQPAMPPPPEVEPVEAAAGEDDDVDADDDGPAPERTVLPARTPGATGWIGLALPALAQRDAAAAARLVLSAVPLHAARLGREFNYVLVPEPLGAYRVTLASGGFAVEQGDHVRNARFAGAPAALAPLLAGGARGRRLPGATVTHRRRARKLRKAMRDPVSLAELAAAGAAPAPADALALLAAAIDPAVTKGAWLTVAFAIEAQDSEAAALSAADGAPLAVLAGLSDDADAIVYAPSRAALLAILAGVAEAPLSGDAQAAATVLRWIDDVQAPAGA